MNPVFLVAIDPGAKGAIAWLSGGQYPNCMRLALGAVELSAQISALPIKAGMPKIAWLEEVSGFVGIPQPGSRMFAFGRSFGHVEAILIAAGFELHRIRPAAWQKFFSALSRRGEPKNAHKRRLAALAKELFPILRDKITLQTADAVLILKYAEMKSNGALPASKSERPAAS